MKAYSVKTFEEAKREVKRTHNTVYLDSGDGWVTVVAWNAVGERVVYWLVNPKGEAV